MTFHVAEPTGEPLRFRLNYQLPPFDLPQVPESEARWVIVPEYLLVYSKQDLVRRLCDRYGAERLVLFDYSDHGDGQYPCQVFALNCRTEFPANVRGYLLPVWGKFYVQDDGQRVASDVPERARLDYDVTFVGDGTSHLCRPPGIQWLRDSSLRTLVKANEDGYCCVVQDSRMDRVYNDSFNSRLVWCPPSRRPIAWRLNEAMFLGVPALSTAVWEKTRLPAAFDWVKQTVNVHQEDMTDFGQVVDRYLADPSLEDRAAAGRVRYQEYCSNFWRFVAAELEKPSV